MRNPQRSPVKLQQTDSDEHGTKKKIWVQIHDLSFHERTLQEPGAKVGYYPAHLWRKIFFTAVMSIVESIKYDQTLLTPVLILLGNANLLFVTGLFHVLPIIPAF